MGFQLPKTVSDLRVCLYSFLIILYFDFEILWMSSQLIVQWNYIIFFYIWGSFLTTFCTSFWKKVHNSKKNCKSARFVCFDLWLHRYQNIYTLTKYYYIIERVYFIYKLLILFISTFSFLLLLYTVSWKYERLPPCQHRYFVLYYVLYY